VGIPPDKKGVKKTLGCHSGRRSRLESLTVPRPLLGLANREFYTNTTKYFFTTRRSRGLGDMEATTLAALLRVARAAVRAAARLTTAVQQGAAGPAVLSKTDLSPVTTADFGAQAVVSSFLRAAVERGEISGPFRCIGEESSASLRSGGDALLESVVAAVEACHPGVAAAGRARAWTIGSVCDAIDAGAYGGDSKEAYWVLDPVDGTKASPQRDACAHLMGRRC
jgi:hypothetical protein